MTTAKETVCSSCHGELGPDINGCIMCYGCGPAELVPPGRGLNASKEAPAAGGASEKPAPAPARPVKNGTIFL